MANLSPLQIIVVFVLSIRSGFPQLSNISLSCSSDRFECTYESKCIPAAYLCDGDIDCDDGSDESASLCAPPCSADMFACQDGLQCIQKSHICNGYRTCNDRSHNSPALCDNCSADHLYRCQKSGVDVCLCAYCPDALDELVYTCRDQRLQPGQYQAVNRNYIANYTEYNDNFTGYDYNYTDYDYGDYGDYPEGEFRCTDVVKSISIYARCDGQPDCLDSSDENGCSEICKPNQFDRPLQWRDNAQEFVEFTSVEDKFGQVNTTMWVLPTAFRCAQSLNDLKNVSIFVSNEVQEKSEADTENTIDEAENIISSPENKNETNTERPANKNETEPKDKDDDNTLSSSPKLTVPNSIQVVNISLYRWRQYEIEVTAKDLNTGETTVAVFEHNTFRWDCKDEFSTKITVTQFCDGKPDCPNKRDEKPEICRVSQLPKKLSYLFYVYMLLFILAYFLYLRIKPQHSQGQYLETIAKKAFNKYLHQRDKSEFIGQYREIHISESKYEKYFGDLKYEMYQNPAKVGEVCSWVREAEEELHKDASAIYDCVLTNFGGSYQVTARIVDPKGSILAKMRSKLNQMIWPRKIKWYLPRIATMFFMLCLHMFDYVKDIGKVTNG